MNAEEIDARIERELDSLRAKSQYRSLEIPIGINLCSNDYLGLATDPRLRQAVVEALRRGGAVGSTGSRLLSGNSFEWEDLECAVAQFAGTEAALYFGSGYAANVGLLSSLLKPADVVFADALNHASLVDGIRLSRAMKVIYPHRDLKFLKNALREYTASGGTKLIVTESLFSMEGDIAPLNEMLDLGRKYGARLVIDEAHATGVYGPRGRGIVAQLGIERETIAIVHTCGKALASAGAFVCGSRVLKEYLVNHARTFIFSTAMPPYLATQIAEALKIVAAADPERSHLREISAMLREGLAAAGINCGSSRGAGEEGATHIVPVILGANEAALHVAGVLQRRGFAAKAIRPPTVPPGTARLRISLTSKITVQDIRRLIAAMAAACENLPRGSAAHMHA
jgi:8-amino-7-oxononanoate synthase